MLQALPPPEPAPAIIVTAPAFPQARAERAFSVEVLDRIDLINSPSVQLDQLLKTVPGLQLFRRSDAQSGHPTSQGVTLRALGGNASSRALLVLDGVPQSDPFGGWVNWPAYDPSSLAEVRVIRGGGSVARGAGALAGTIEMTSLLDRGVGGELLAGSRASFAGRASMGVLVGHGTMILSARAVQGAGFIPITSGTRGPADRRAPYESASVRGHLAMPLSSSVQAEASLAGFRDIRERGLRFTRNRTDGADSALRLVGSGRWGWTALAYVQWRELESSFASVDAGRAKATRVAFQDSVPSRGLGGSFELRPPVGHGLELRLGADGRHTRGETRELYSFVGDEPTRRRIAGGETLSSGLFVELAADIGKLALNGGLRVDHWRIEDGRFHERQIATGEELRSDLHGSRFGWLPTARAGAVLDAGDGVSVRLASYLGWRLPTLNELFRPFRAGADAIAANPELDPERLSGAEVGVRYARPGLSLTATAFINRLYDGIANVTLGRGPGIFPGVGFVGAAGDYRQRRNLDSIDVRGIELSGEATRGAWSGQVGYSFANARVRAGGDAAALQGLRPAQTPRHMLTAGVQFQDDGRVAGLQFRRIGSQFEDDLNQLRLSPAITIDAFGALPLDDRLQVIIRAENVLDERVVAGVGFEGAVERATPRALFIGLRLNARGAPRNDAH